MRRDQARRIVSDLSTATLPDAGSRVLLVVEDTPGVVLMNVLRGAGFDVTQVESARAARRLYKTDADFLAAVLDYHLPDEPATGVVAELVSRTPLCRSVVLGGDGHLKHHAEETARVGAFMYLQQPCALGSFLTAVRMAVKATRQWRAALEIPRSVEREPAVFDMRAALDRLRDLGKLTTMEYLVCWRLLWGDSNKRIATLLGLAEGTVKYHVTQVLQKTGATSRTGLLRVLLEAAGYRDPWHGPGG